MWQTHRQLAKSTESLHCWTIWSFIMNQECTDNETVESEIKWISSIVSSAKQATVQQGLVRISYEPFLRSFFESTYCSCVREVGTSSDYPIILQWIFMHPRWWLPEFFKSKVQLISITRNSFNLSWFVKYPWFPVTPCGIDKPMKFSKNGCHVLSFGGHSLFFP